MRCVGITILTRCVVLLRLALIAAVSLVGIACKRLPDPEDPLDVEWAGSRKAFELVPDVLLEFCWVPPGRVSIGFDSDPSKSSTGPLREIEIKEGFWMSSCEVPRGVWNRVMCPDVAVLPEKADFPVDSVSWWETMNFIKRLVKPGKHWIFDLPTDVQWEYACRAGSAAEFYGDPLQIGWVQGNSDGGTHPVGQLAPNAWGLFDMHGNVAEWCKNSTDGKNSDRIIHGGSWASDWYAQASVRNSDVPCLKFNQLGFRLIIRREVP